VFKSLKTCVLLHFEHIVLRNKKHWFSIIFSSLLPPPPPASFIMPFGCWPKYWKNKKNHWFLEKNKQMDQIKIIDFGTSLFFDNENSKLDEKINAIEFVNNK
jgi:hypothetical protein